MAPKSIVSTDDAIISASEPAVYASPQGGVPAVNETAGDIVFRTAGVERARIKADGTGTGWPNVLGGSLPALGAVPGYTDSIGNNLIVGSKPANIVPGAVTNAHGNAAFGIGWRGALPQTGSLGQITTGYDNTTLGAGSMISLTSGHSNTALGADTLSALTTGNTNVGLGAQSGESITSGSDNVGVGGNSNAAVTTGTSNVAIGSNSLVVLTTGSANIAIGGTALGAATTAVNNVAVGYQAGYTATAGNATVVGSRNVFVGYQSGAVHAFDPADSVAVGYQALADYDSIAIGSGVQAHAAGAVAIGRDHLHNAVATTVQDQIALGTANHHTLWKTAADPGAAVVAASQFTLWLDPTNGAGKLMIRAKTANGTSVTGSVTLA